GTAAFLSTRCANSLTFGNPLTAFSSTDTLPTHHFSQSGLLELSLQARQQPVPLGNQTATLLTYNGQVPGPILEAKTGDTVRIDFENQLAQTSNLHFHGLHIPPTGNADNVFLAVPSGATQRYEFVVPGQHPGGLFWYHPHHHGVVAEQVFGGLAGPLIIRGQVDEIPEVRAAEEAILVLQDFDLNRQGQPREPMPMFRRWGRQGNLITVNGELLPTLTIPQSGLLRVRLLNASPSRIYRLRLDNHPWHLMGLDGGTLPDPVEIEEDLILAPGERADILVPGTREPNRYSLLSLPYDRGITDMMGGMGGRHHRRAVMDHAPREIARLQYGETTTAVPLPKTLIPTTSLPETIRRREFVLDHGIDHGHSFLINGQGFDHHRVDTPVQLGTVEDWRIINKAGMDHPFHVHTNAFQVLNRNGQSFPFQVWKDVVNVKAYEFVDLRIAFNDFPGKTVYHCHILDHEDQGMMGILEIQPASV
ncbi:MAG: multicopper oxidase family protein, partial [Cyanobacteria bacterium P01_E01_bin.43]